MRPTAKYWHQEHDKIRCELCPHYCLIASEETGRCHIRVNQNGQLLATAYGQVTACAVDPIEKKPLYHVKPGQPIFSIGSTGCNFKCVFCQNWEISQGHGATTTMTPEQVTDQALQTGCCGVAYTYNEPIINIEYILDCVQVVKAQGLINVMVSNGYINSKPLEALLPWIDAWNIDLKSMSDSFYREVCGGQVKPVKKTIEQIAAAAHLEVTHLMVTDPRHTRAHTEKLIDWLAGVSTNIPLHLSRYFPQYQYTAEATSAEVMQAAFEYGQEKMKWVYLGNIQQEANPTTCPQCHAVLIERHGFQGVQSSLTRPQCPHCQEPFYGIL